jgi:hypothetical protein
VAFATAISPAIHVEVALADKPQLAYGQTAPAVVHALMSATAFAGVGLLFWGMLPPLPNHFSSVSKDAVPLPIIPSPFIRVHMVEALLKEGLMLPPWQPDEAQFPGVPDAK